MRQLVAATTPWALLAGVDLLDAANVIPPPAGPLHQDLCAACICVTLAVLVHRFAHKVRAADRAVTHGYAMAGQHCLEYHRAAIPELRQAVGGDTPTAVLQTVNGGTVYTSAAAQVPARRPAPGPRHLASVKDN